MEVTAQVELEVLLCHCDARDFSECLCVEDSYPCQVVGQAWEKGGKYFAEVVEVYGPDGEVIDSGDLSAQQEDIACAALTAQAAREDEEAWDAHWRLENTRRAMRHLAQRLELGLVDAKGAKAELLSLARGVA